MRLTYRFSTVCNALLAGIALVCCSVARADDTEIFVQQAERAGVRPNVLLIVDTSRRATEAHFENVRAVAVALLKTLENANVGIMRLSNNDEGRAEESAAEGGMVVHALADIGTARPSLVQALESLVTGGHASLSEALYEAGAYFAGRNVDYGLASRIDLETPFPSVAEARDPAQASRYRSPWAISCQRSFVVLISAGEPSYDNGADGKIASLPGFADLVGDCDGAGPGRCLPALARYLYETDLAPLPGRQQVVTYTVGVGASSTGEELLRRTASAGGGESYSAEDVAELIAAIQALAANVLQRSVIFAAPAVPVSAFAQTHSRNELYVSMFRPEATLRWPGNLKKYTVRGGRVVDAAGAQAVDAATGRFRDTARSFWSPQPDGDLVQLGGAASQLPEAGARRLHTFLEAAGTRDLTSVANAFALENPHLTAEVLGLDETGPTREQLVSWVRGADVQDADADGNTAETRRSMGDPLHASAAVVTYGGAAGQPDLADAVAYLPTNDGFLHAMDARSGRELWAFIAPELLERLQTLYRNPPAARRSHGLDGDVRALLFDADRNGIIEPARGDKVWIYFGMRRGGHHYYALDVSHRERPQLLWRIGPDQLPGVGETWSAPTFARVRVSGVAQNSEHLVVLLGGGYDERQEHYGFTADEVGRQIFMVDAESGALLWRAGGSGSPDLPLSRMTHSIPGRIVALDTDADQYADRLYAADTGGRLWRFDVWNGKGPGELVTGGVIASLGNADDASHPIESTRRFYQAPDVALVQNPGADPYYNLAIGSGYRGHPLHAATRDRFYAVRDKQPYRKLAQSEYDSLRPIRDEDLVDIAADIVGTAVPADRPGWKLELRLHGGWRGEKVLTEALTVAGVVMFTTFEPAASSVDDPCTPGSGRNRAYALQVDDGRPALDFDQDAEISAADVSSELGQGGIASGVSWVLESALEEQGSEGGTNPGAGRDLLRRRSVCVVGVEVLGACVEPGGLIRAYWQRPALD